MTANGTALPLVEPLVTPETEPYFSAAASGRLVLPRCRDCGWLIWYPRQFCNECGSLDVEWVPVSGHGRVYTFSVVRRGQGAYRDAAPYLADEAQLRGAVGDRSQAG